MNQLPLAKRAQILNMLVEGSSLRATARISGCSINTTTKLLLDAGRACENFHNEIVMHVKADKIQCDEVWSYIGCKAKNLREDMEEGWGDCWTWTCLEADSKLIISWYAGNRDAEAAHIFMNDVATRIHMKPNQITTDGLHEYQQAVIDALGVHVNFAQLVKRYSNPNEVQTPERKYSPSKYIGARKKIVLGQPERAHISTSYIERSNLTLRMHNRRFTRLTNAFSKKLENHALSLALHFTFYNFVRPHKTLRVTPAMAAGLSKRFLTIEDIVNLIDGIQPKLVN